MTSRLFTLLLALCLALSLAACTRDGAPTSSVPAPESTTTTAKTTEMSTTTSTRTTSNCQLFKPEDYPSGLKFTSFEEYKNTMLTLTDKDTLYQAFADATKYDVFKYAEAGFETLLTDRSFLVPILPKGSSLKEAYFTSIGHSEFDVYLENGETVYFLCYHSEQEPSRLTRYAERTSFVNSRGITVEHEWHTTGTSSGQYVWLEGDNYCWLPYTNKDTAVLDAFVKELSFEKISTDA